MNPPDQLIADARNHLDLLNDAARKREGARIIERLLARVRELESTLAERWPNLSHQDRDQLIADADTVIHHAADIEERYADHWLLSAVRVARAYKLAEARVRELEADRAGLRWSDTKPTPGEPK